MLDTLPHNWPDPAPTEILPGLWQGGTSESSHLGQPTKSNHYRGERPFDLIVTLYADAQPAPWGVEEIRYGFPDGELDANDLRRLRDVALLTAERWEAGDRILVRCQAGVNRSGLVVALVLEALGWEASDAVDLLRARRSGWVLSNTHFLSALGIPSG